MTLNDIKNKVKYIYQWEDGIYSRRQIGGLAEVWDGKKWMWRTFTAVQAIQKAIQKAS